MIEPRTRPEFCWGGFIRRCWFNPSRSLVAPSLVQNEFNSDRGISCFPIRHHGCNDCAASPCPHSFCNSWWSRSYLPHCLITSSPGQCLSYSNVQITHVICHLVVSELQVIYLLSPYSALLPVHRSYFRNYWEGCSRCLHPRLVRISVREYLTRLLISRRWQHIC